VVAQIIEKRIMNRAPTVVNWTKGQRNVRKFVEKVYATDTSSSKTEKAFHIILTLFWIVIYLTGVVLTALTGRNLYEQYQENPVSIAVTPLHNVTMTFMKLLKMLNITCIHRQLQQRRMH
jgi:cytochrome b subunit of formate dehydrogenase